jgi:hypothetical protein
MSLIVNVKVQYLRPKYDNLKEWNKDPNNVYIGRRGVVFVDGKRYPEKDSIWANPFKIDKNTSRDEVIDKYKKYIIERINKDEKLKEELLKLKDKTLGCWCHPEKCHGDVLIELINE